MFNAFLKTTSLILPLLLLGCGEITYDDANTSPQVYQNNPNTATAQNSSNDVQYDNSNIDNAQQANETISGAEANSQKLSDIIEIINTMNQNSNNEAQKREILNWVEKVATEVNELTAKDFTSLVNTYRDLPLYAVNDNIFSTNKDFGDMIFDSGYISGIDESLVIIKGDCEGNYVKNSIFICTGNVDYDAFNHAITIGNGTINLSAANIGLRAETSLGALIYSKKSIYVSSLEASVLAFSNPIQYSKLENTDCINTEEVSGSVGVCNKISTNNLLEN